MVGMHLTDMLVLLLFISSIINWCSCLFFCIAVISPDISSTMFVFWRDLPERSHWQSIYISEYLLKCEVTLGNPETSEARSRICGALLVSYLYRKVMLWFMAQLYNGLFGLAKIPRRSLSMEVFYTKFHDFWPISVSEKTWKSTGIVLKCLPVRLDL